MAEDGKPDREHRDEGGLSRWSRLKRKQTVGQAGSAPPEPPSPIPAASNAADAPDATNAADDSAGPPAPMDPGVLETLDANSDYRVFLQEHVPEAIRREALRLLWRSDPVFANLDGLNDYDEDYRHIGRLAEAVRTAYQAGKGYVDSGGDDAAAATADSSPQPDAQPTANRSGEQEAAHQAETGAGDDGDLEGEGDPAPGSDTPDDEHVGKSAG